MLSAIELIEQLNKLDESVWIEAKKGSSIGKSIMETICAFANEPGMDGGYLLLGVEKKSADDNLYTIVGVDNPDKIQQDIINQCCDTFNHPLRPKVRVEEIDGKALIIIKVDESSNIQKPIYFKKTGLPRGAFRRIGSSDHRCTEDDISTLYANQSLESYDFSQISDCSLEDIDTSALKIYRNLRKQINADAEELNWPDEEMMYSIGCLKKTSQGYIPTVAGILLFGTSSALRRFFPMMRIDYIRIPGNKWIEDTEHQFETIEVRKPLIEAVQRIQNTIIEDIPKTFHLPEGSLQNKPIPLLPHRVIREALVNAVMHRSYRVNGAIQVLKYGNRLEIRNPGHSLKSQDRLGEPGSKTRNPKIAAVFHDLGIAETKGSGIRVMRQLMKENNLFEPAFESTREPDEFTATFLFHHFLEIEDIKWLKTLNKNFTQPQMRAIFFVKETGTITNSIYREINQTGTLDSSADLRKLRDMGLLEQNGGGSKTYYTPGEKLINSIKNTDGRQYDISSEHLEINSEHLEINSEHLVQLNKIARAVAGTKKIPHDMISKTITDMCSICELSMRQIADMLNRKDDTIRNHYVNPLCKKGKLSLKYPDIKHHPGQKYFTARKDD